MVVFDILDGDRFFRFEFFLVGVIVRQRFFFWSQILNFGYLLFFSAFFIFSIGDLFFELFDDPEAKLFFAFLLALPLPVEQRVVSIFDHVLSARLFQYWHQLAPPLSEL